VSDLTAEYVSTGIPGVDEILAGKGIPRDSTILLSGGPGSGKTTFAIQFLYTGITQYGESGVYVTLDEDPSDIKVNMTKFGWDLKRLEDEKKLVFINVSPVRVAPSDKVGLIQIGMKEFRLIKLLEAIKGGIDEVNAKRVIVDPLTIFTLQ
jgi:KaiC/GvpD/RAD55 family RecA-like ATPase